MHQLEVEMVCTKCGSRARTFKHHLCDQRETVFSCRMCGGLRRVYLNGKEVYYSA